MNAIAFDVLGKALANGSLGRIRGISCAHHFAPLCDGAVSLEHHDDDRAFGHKCDQAREERPLLVDGVKCFGFVLGDAPHLQTGDAETALLYLSQDFADLALGDRVRLDDCEGTL